MAREALLTEAEKLGIHIQRIREEVERISAMANESDDNHEKILDLLQRQTELLESIDHWHYRTVSNESVILGRIFWTLVLLLVVNAASLFAM